MSGLPSRSMSTKRTPSALPSDVAEPGLAGDVGERAVAIVAIQHADGAVVHDGRTVVPHARRRVAAEEILVARVVGVLPDEEVEVAVAVVVAPGGARPPGRVPDAGLRRVVREGAVAVVVVQDVAPVAGHEQVHESIVVVVRRDGAHAVARVAEAGLLGDVRERAVAIVAEETAARPLGLRRRQRARLHDVEVHPAVVVVVEPGQPRADHLGQAVLGRRTPIVHETEPGRIGDVRERDGAVGGRGVRRARRQGEEEGRRGDHGFDGSARERSVARSSAMRASSGASSWARSSARTASASRPRRSRAAA